MYFNTLFIFINVCRYKTIFNKLWFNCISNHLFYELNKNNCVCIKCVFKRILQNPVWNCAHICFLGIKRTLSGCFFMKPNWKISKKSSYSETLKIRNKISNLSPFQNLQLHLKDRNGEFIEFCIVMQI